MAAFPLTVLPQLARYGTAGLAVNGALYLVYLGFTALGLTPVVASSLVFALGVPVSLTAHRRFTFRVREVSTARKGLFALGYLVGYGVQIGTLSALHHGLGLPHPIAQLVAIVAVALVLFVYQKHVVFKA